MKKWIGIFLVVIGGLVYAIFRLSVSEYQAISETSSTKAEAPSAKPADANDGEPVEPAEEQGSPATAAQVEAVTKAWGEFQSAVKSKDCERAWELMSGPLQQKTCGGSLGKFRKGVAGGDGAVLTAVVIHLESATNVADCVRVLATVPSEKQDMYLFFAQDDGQWKWNDVRPSEGVDVPSDDTPATAAESEAVNETSSQSQSTLGSEDDE